MSKSIEIRPGKYEDVMPDMSEEEYSALKESIERNGFDETTPIIVDQTGNIVDGHHRFKACQELGVTPEYITVENPNLEQAYRSNLARRDLDGGEKREVVKRYLEEHYDEERTQKEVAADLGVSQSTVSRAWKDIRPDKFTREEKRQQVAGYLEANPDASNREVARSIEADVSHPTVGGWREEWESPPKEDPELSDESLDTVEQSEQGFEEGRSEPLENETGGAGAEPGSVVETHPGANQQGGTEGEELEPHLLDQPDTTPEKPEIERKNDRISQLESRIDVLETVLRQVIRAKENQDPLGLEDAVEQAGELLSV